MDNRITDPASGIWGFPPEQNSNMLERADDDNDDNGTEDNLQEPKQPSDAVDSDAKLQSASYSKISLSIPTEPTSAAAADIVIAGAIDTTAGAIDPTADEQFSSEPDQRAKYLKIMREYYIATAAESLVNERRENSNKKCHTCISALICHQKGKSPHVAVLCTGTNINDNRECYSIKSNCPCDGHAESLCYEVAPMYFQREMSHCLEKKESIFIFENEHFKLKHDVTFHLLVTEYPCGWIRENKSPRMQWKINFKGAPHIPRCSSKILINSKMGVQGYISHLLDDCIFIKSVVILCTKEDEVGPLEYDEISDFFLPTFSVMHYDPNLFNPNECTFRPLNLPKKDTTKNGTNKINGENEKGPPKSNVNIGKSDVSNVWHYKYDFKPCEKNEKDREIDRSKTLKKDLSIVERKIDSTLSDKVSLTFQEQRKEDMKQKYNNLLSLLKVTDELKKLLSQLEEQAKTRSEKICEKVCGDDLNSFTEDIKIKMQELREFKYSIEEWKEKITEMKTTIDKYQTEGVKLIDVQNMIKDIKEILKKKSNIVIDCAWQRYFNL